jgi:hypothetical protein
MRPSSFHRLQQISINRGFHIASVPGLAAVAMLPLVLSFSVAAGSSALDQTQWVMSAVKGTVVATDGKPLRAVEVYGGNWSQLKSVTNGRGEFSLEIPGSVIHFYKNGLQPLTLIVSPKDSVIRVVMSPSRNDMIVPKCAPPPPGQKLVPGSGYGLHFFVPEKGVKLLGGKLDVDYRRFCVEPEGGKAYLELWFGPYAISTEPDDDLFLGSVDFFQRNLTAADGRVIGMDSWGHMRNGAWWRWTAVAGSGAVYKNVSTEEAQLFDQIISSMCIVPYPLSGH